MQPREQVRTGELRRAYPIIVDLFGGEQRVALTRFSLPEERAAVFENARLVGREMVGPGPHVRERGRLDQPWPYAGRHLDAEPGRDPPHLAIEVGGEVVVVHEQYVRFGSAPPRVGEVPQHTR